MITTSQIPDQLKSALSVKDMAGLCGLSRQRFAQLVKAGVFPAPLYDVATRRPFYPEDAQRTCLEVRRRNFGINGKAVLFYSRRVGPALTRPKPVKSDQYPEIIDGLRALGLATVTSAQVAEAVKAAFPAGTDSIDQAEVVRAVFMHLRRKFSGVNVGGK
jgi:hypothetical protein